MKKNLFQLLTFPNSKIAFPRHIVAIVLFFSSVSALSAIGKWNEEWLTLATPQSQFLIIYPKSQSDLARYYASIAEESLSSLKPIFNDIPSQITVIINDSTDLSNGYASIIPYPHIMIYPVQIGEESALSESGHWAKELFIHELTHILQLYPAHGFYDFLKPIFGTVIAPNLLLPVWWKEGMAVEIETQFSAQGRLKSHFQSATTRAFFIDGQLEKYTLAQANESLMKWPYGNLPYYWGSYLMSELVEQRQLPILGSLSLKQSSRVPYFIDAPIIELSGGSYEVLFRRTQENLVKISQDQVTKIKSSELTKDQPIDSRLRSARQPKMHPKLNRLALIGTDDNETELKMYEKVPGNNHWTLLEQKTKITGAIESFVFHPIENKIYFTKQEKRNLQDTFSEIYVFDFDAQKQTQLTFDQRARQLAISPDGKTIAFIGTGNGKTELKEFVISSQKVFLLQSEPFDRRLNGLTFIDRDKLFFSVRNQNGQQENFIRFANSLANSFVNSTVQKVDFDSSLRFPRAIQNQLYYVSSKSGVLNIYSSAIDLPPGKDSLAITNVLTGVQSFDVDVYNKKIFFTKITSSGLQVFESDLPQSPLKLESISLINANRYQSVAAPKMTDSQIQIEEYSGSDYLWPKFWVPFIATSSSKNGLFLQAMTAGFDPLQFHTYQVQLSYDSAINKLGYYFNYINSKTPWAVSLTADQSQIVFGTSNNLVEKRSTSVTLLPDVFDWNKSLVLGFGPAYYAHATSTTTEHAGAFASAQYSSIEQKPFHYYPMSGWGALGKIERNFSLKDFGSLHQTFTRVIGGASYYNSDFLPQDHVAVLRANLLYIPEEVSARYGTSNGVFPTSGDSLKPEFNLRGYKSGGFFGTQLATVTTEYRLPIKDIFRGSGSSPFFLKHVTGALVFDGLTSKGLGLTENETFVLTQFGETFWSAGLEARFSTTVGYLLPMNFVLGAYLPFSPAFAKSGTFGLSLQIGGF